MFSLVFLGAVAQGGGAVGIPKISEGGRKELLTLLMLISNLLLQRNPAKYLGSQLFLQTSPSSRILAQPDQKLERR